MEERTRDGSFCDEDCGRTMSVASLRILGVTAGLGFVHFGVVEVFCVLNLWAALVLVSEAVFFL